jgi:predicted SAM-dependent methyltransferase
MDRNIPNWLDPIEPQLNLGIGHKDMGEIPSIGLPYWNAEQDMIPRKGGSVGTIWALHFLEHIQNVMWVLRECQRVLQPGGLLNIVVPYGACHMYVHDLTHKHMFNEDTWRQTFRNAYYDDKGTDWLFDVGANFIMAVKGENLALFTQLIKKG